LRAIEGYTSSLAGYERHVAPIGNFVIATEPLSDARWAQIGLSNRELFEDSSPLLGYGQRTHDGRIVWGGQSAAYWYRSRPPTSPMRHAKATERLRSLLIAVFPSLDDVEITHEWGGVLGASRDLRPSVGFDHATGMAWLGSYFGAGIAPSNAAARTLVDLINHVDSHRRHLPWTNHRSRRWEPEPLRWLGITTTATAAKLANRKDQPSSTRRMRALRGKP
jgi:glycine/D-amino acid oxidase-like deaminating enzyme